MTRQPPTPATRSRGPRTNRLLGHLAAAAMTALATGASVACRRSPTEPAQPSTATSKSAEPAAPTSPLEDQLAVVPEGWDPEAFALALRPTLARLSKVLERDEEIDGADFRHALHATFVCDPLRPSVFEPALELGPLTRRKAITAQAAPAPAEALDPDAPAAATDPDSPADPVVLREQGTEGLVSGLTDLRSLWHGSSAAVEFKVVGVEPLDLDRATTILWVQSHGPGPRHFEARWRCTWGATRSSDPWLLSIDVLAHEEVERRTPDPFFADRTTAVLGQSPRFDVLLRPGLDHWLAQLDRSLGGRSFGYHGLSVADVDGDGLDDLYVCLNGGLPNRLFVQSPDGSATDRSQISGLDFLDHTESALFVDLDGDGDQDAVLGTSELVLLQNDGQTRFEPAARFSGSGAAFGSLAAADYDLDGDLDLYACASSTDERTVPDPFFDAHNGPPNRMLRNDGEWRFTDVTETSGLNVGNDRFSQSAAWADYDGDGDPDLHVANDFGRDNLFQNDGGTFRDVAREAGVVGLAAGHSADWGDANGDGRPDLYVGNVFASAGHRLSSLWHAGAGALSRHELFERSSQGNTLHLNQGDGTFRDVSAEQGVALGRWAWSSLFAEVDNDGQEDLLVANGFVTTEIEEDL